MEPNANTTVQNSNVSHCNGLFAVTFWLLIIFQTIWSFQSLQPFDIQGDKL